MYCQNCGAENKDGAKFCCQCGSELLGINKNKGTDKPKRKSKKTAIISLVIAVIAATLIVIGFTGDFKSILLNDFEYYLYLEKKNAADFFGKDFIDLIENYNSFSSETTVNASMTGESLEYDSNEDDRVIAEIMDKTSLMLRTDYNGSDVLNLDMHLVEKNNLAEMIDLIVTFLNNDVIIASDYMSEDLCSISKTVGMDLNINRSNVKVAAENLLLSIYERFGKFEEYITVETKDKNGEKLTEMTFDFNYRFISDLTGFVIFYVSEDEVLLDLVEKCFAFLHKIEETDLYDWLEDEGYDNFKEAFDDEFSDFEDDFWWIQDKLEFEYEVTFNEKDEIKNRELIIREVEDDNEVKIECKTHKDSTGSQIIKLKIDDDEFLSLDNCDDKISVSTVLDSEIWGWNIDCSYDKDTVDFTFHGYDNKYNSGCEYNEYTDSYEYFYDTLILDVELKTVMKDYSFTPDLSMNENAKPLKDSDFAGEVESLNTHGLAELIAEIAEELEIDFYYPKSWEYVG